MMTIFYCEHMGYRFLLMTSLLLMRWGIVECQSGWGSGFETTSEENEYTTPAPITDTIFTTAYTATSSTTGVIITTDNTTTAVPAPNTTVITGWGSGSETTTDENEYTNSAPTTDTIFTSDNTTTAVAVPNTTFITVCPDTCPENSACTNSENGCECDGGYQEDGTSGCTDIDECITECKEDERKCSNFPGYYSCECKAGFYPKGQSCIKVCPDSCPENSACTNAENGCECDGGYQEDGTGRCTDIDECITECKGGERECSNFPGYYSCECKTGFYPKGQSCIKELPECPSCVDLAHTACTDPNVGCECVNGWAGNPNACQDVDECLSECENPTLICTNTPGSFFCSCLDGYRPGGNDISIGCIPETCSEEKLSCSSLPDGLCENDDEVVTFPATLFGYSSKSINTCAPGTTNSGKSFGTRACSIDGSWQTPQWLPSCDTGIQDLTVGTIETEEEREEVSSNLEALTSNPGTLNTEDIASTTAVIENVTAAESLEPTVATSVISTISNVAESPSLADSGQTEVLLSQLDDVASKVVLTDNKPYIAVSNNVSMIVSEANNTTETGIGVAILVRPDSSSLGFRSDQFQTIDRSISSGDVLAKNAVQGSIYVPSSALNKTSRVAVYVFGNNNLFPVSSNQSSTSTGILSSNDVLVNNIVLSATVEGVYVTQLPNDDRLTFSTPIDNNTIEGKPLCAFWEESVNAWSTEGCEVDFDKTTNTSISCSCNHLTNFATLLDISGDITIDVYALDIITIVGCSVSSFCLILTIAVFIFVPNTRKGRKFRASFLLINFSLALLGLNISLLVSEMPFLTSPDSAEEMKSSCVAMAALLHLFLLCTCAWMNCEAINLYIAVRKPFYARNEVRTSRVITFSSLWGWLMPLVFVGITLAADKTVYDRLYEGESKVTCWIVADMVLYITVIPLAIMIGFNLVIYVILTNSLCRNRSNTWGPTWRSQKSSVKNKLIVNFSLMVIVGVTWVFGLLIGAFAFNETTALVFAYIFTILNSLQGVFIFLLYIVRNKEIRQSIRKDFYGLSGSTTAGTFHNTAATRKMNRRGDCNTTDPYLKTDSDTRNKSRTDDWNLEYLESSKI